MDPTKYLRELSELGRRFGFGLTGNAQLYHLEPEDQLFDYSADADGMIALGSLGDADADARAGAGRNTQRGLDARAAADVE